MLTLTLTLYYLWLIISITYVTYFLTRFLPPSLNPYQRPRPSRCLLFAIFLVFILHSLFPSLHLIPTLPR